MGYDFFRAMVICVALLCGNSGPPGSLFVSTGAYMKGVVMHYRFLQGHDLVVPIKKALIDLSARIWQFRVYVLVPNSYF